MSNVTIRQMLEAALLRYLAVAHFGRGRGDWAQGESPAHWREVVQRALLGQREALAMIWRERDGVGGKAAGDDAPEAERLIAAALEPVLAQAMGDALRSLYPDAALLRESSQHASPPSQ
mgnify:CR=1 FL=1